MPHQATRGPRSTHLRVFIARSCRVSWPHRDHRKAQLPRRLCRRKSERAPRPRRLHRAGARSHSARPALRRRRADRHHHRHRRDGQDAPRARVGAEGSRRPGSRRGELLFCDLSEARDIDDACAVFARAFAVPLAAAATADEIVAQLGRALGESGPCVVILDNLEQLVALAPRILIPGSRWRPARGSSSRHGSGSGSTTRCASSSSRSPCPRRTSDPPEKSRRRRPSSSSWRGPARCASTSSSPRRTPRASPAS